MRNFNRFMEHFLEYKDYYGDGLVPYRYQSPDGYPLGQVIHNIRVGAHHLTSEQRQIVDNSNFEWNGTAKRIQPVTFEKYYSILQAHYNKYGNCDVNQRYVNENGDTIGIIVSIIRSREKSLNDKQRERLNQIEFVWKKRNKRTRIEELCILLNEYKARNSHCYIPHTYITPDGILLGEICRNIRNGRRKTTTEEKKKLAEAGFVWNPREYAREHNISFNYKKRPI